MFSLAIIVFSEVLEISLILGVVLVATRGLPGRDRWVLVGLGAGIVGSGALAFGAGAISEAVSGMGQEFFNATVLFLAAMLIGWTVVWLRRHSVMLSRRIKAVGKDVGMGTRPLYVIATVVAMAVLREGSEIVLLTYGVMISGGTLVHLLVGGGAGLLAGTFVGAAIYYGIIRVATRYMFAVTSALLTFLAAGMVSQAIEILESTGVFPVFDRPIWDTSRLLSEHSLLGSTMHSLVGYSAQPTGMQFGSFVLTLGILLTLLRLYGNSRHMASTEVRK